MVEGALCALLGDGARLVAGPEHTGAFVLKRARFFSFLFLPRACEYYTCATVACADAKRVLRALNTRASGCASRARSVAASAAAALADAPLPSLPPPPPACACCPPRRRRNPMRGSAPPWAASPAASSAHMGAARARASKWLSNGLCIFTRALAKVRALQFTEPATRPRVRGSVSQLKVLFLHLAPRQLTPRSRGDAQTLRCAPPPKASSKRRDVRAAALTIAARRARHALPAARGGGSGGGVRGDRPARRRSAGRAGARQPDIRALLQSHRARTLSGPGASAADALSLEGSSGDEAGGGGAIGWLDPEDELEDELEGEVRRGVSKPSQKASALRLWQRGTSFRVSVEGVGNCAGREAT